MITQEILFPNRFNTPEIIPSRLYNFTDDAIGRFTAANKSNLYNTIIANLQLVNDAFGEEIGEVKSTLGVQKGSTLTVNEVIKSFKTYMSDNEGVIAKAVGGFKSAAYTEFYPNGVTEYSSITKTKMPAVLKQVLNAAEKYKAKLGTTTTAELKAFTKQYSDTRDAQVNQKGTVKENRTERTSNRTAVELELMKTIFSVGLMHTGDVEKCGSFFNFSLLYANSRAKKKVVEGQVGNG